MKSFMIVLVFLGCLVSLMAYSPSNTDDVYEIRIESPFSGKTEDNIGIGAALSDIENTYGQPEEIFGEWYYYPSIGISFKISNDIVIMIKIYEADALL